MSEKHFSIFRHKNVYEVPHKSQYISEFSEITAYAKAPSRDSRKGACFLLRRIVLSSPAQETDRTLISRIGSEDAEDTQEQVDDVEVKIDCAVHCVIKCLRIHLRFAVVVADV